jgi:PAS domain S-box-containing protein
MEISQVCGQYPELLDMILSCRKQAVILSDCTGRILATNPGAEDMLGYSLNEFNQILLERIFTPEDRTYYLPNILTLAGRGEMFEGEALLKRRDETLFFAHLNCRPLIDPNGDGSTLAMCIHDIDKIKRLEKANKDLFFDDLVKVANGIAHELRNPLVGIGGFAQRIYKSCQASDADERYYHYMVSNLKKIENLVKKVDFLVSLPKPNYHSEAICRLVDTAAQPFLAQIQAHGIRFENLVDDNQVIVDGSLVIRALSILFENALDATPDKGWIRVESQMGVQQYELQVTDNGTGISPEDLPYLFTPFFSTKPHGAGIDLAVVRRIMESHGGEATARSQPGQGTTFRLTFPLERRRTIRVKRFE